MTITRIRGGQIKDNTITGVKIIRGEITNEHISENTKIEEKKLDINWSGHYKQALETKKVVDYVQLNGTEVGGLSSIDITDIANLRGLPMVNSNSEDEGVIVEGDKNKAIVREHGTSKTILANVDSEDITKIKEVYGRVSYEEPLTEGEDGKFILTFYYFDDEIGDEVEFTMPEDQKIDWQFLRRFNLATVDELFAANEKFVEGVADASVYLNLEQLAKDLYGASYSLDRDGKNNLEKSLAEQLSDEIDRATTAEQGLQGNIDDEIQARKDADNKIISDLASTTTDKGANLIGTSGTFGKDKDLVGATVETVLEDLQERLVYQEENGGQEVTDAHTRSDNTPNDYYVAKTYNTLKERLDEIETIADGEFKKAKDTTDEVVAARGSATSLSERLNTSLDENGKLKVAHQIHTHKKYSTVIENATKIIDMPENQFFVPNDGSLDVYINGILQANGINFIEKIDGNGRGYQINFGEDQLLSGDVVVIKYIEFNE